MKLSVLARMFGLLSSMIRLDARLEKHPSEASIHQKHRYIVGCLHSVLVVRKPRDRIPVEK